MAAPAPEQHSNNFDAIRIAAAFAVLVSHHFALTGQPEPSFLGLRSWGSTAVITFFIISGYLVTASWYKDPHFIRFSLRRILRIWPALTVVVILTAYVLGAWVTTLSLSDYWLHPATFDYLKALRMQIVFVLPGVFENNPHSPSVNGSLWTIPLEVRCYAVLALAGLLGLMKWQRVWLLSIAVYMVWFFVNNNPDVTGKIHSGRELSAFFLMGSALSILQPRWQQHPRAWWLILGALATLAWLFNWRNTSLFLIFPFLVIYIGTRSWPVICRFGRWGDPSYGLYLFAFPIQQTIIQKMWPEAGFATTLILASITTLVFAYISWHTVEKHALRLKPTRRAAKREARAIALPKGVQNLFFNASQVHWLRFLFSAAWLAWMLTTALQQVIHFFPAPDAELNGDAYWTYLPNARKFLANPWEFLTTDMASLHVAPLSYLWPAMWGADPVMTQIANSVLYLLSIVLMWHLATRLGGLVAGMVATALLTHFPDLASYVPQVLTEPPYMFGLLLFLTGLAEYLLAPRWRTAWLFAATAGLAITLLVRPVWQIYTLLALAVLVGLLALYRFKPQWRLDHGAVVNRQTVLALALALALPALVVVKNGVSFSYWGISTGAGSGLFYGLSPFKMGIEPVYGGFTYDAGVVSDMAAPASKGSPLHIQADQAQSRVAFGIIQATTWQDNLAFFWFKLKAWLFYGAEDLVFQSKLHRFRLFEWLAILGGAICLAHGHWVLRRKAGSPAAVAPAGKHLQNARQTGLALFILLMALGMAAQLVPVLYNTRYSTFLMDLLLMPLAGMGAALMASALADRLGPGWRAVLQIPVALLVVSLLLAAAKAATQSAVRHASWSMDPARPGPTTLVLGRDHMGTASMSHARRTADGAWVLSGEAPSTLSVPFTLTEEPQQFQNAIWRFKLAMSPPRPDRQCKKIHVALDVPSPEIGWYIPRPIFHAQPDGQPHLYAMRGNGSLRPAASGRLHLVFHCPAGTIVHWHGAQLLRSTMAEAARSLVLEGIPIQPYRADDI
ncbi:acyltransferase [Comamonadaceae bacterium OH2545_COT-014]|nr:acyltransferase [Comamonadaceae bacterium OH2545_COT-014]